jgi:hypothetical protein
LYFKGGKCRIGESFSEINFVPLHKALLENSSSRDTLTNDGWKVNFLSSREKKFQSDAFIKYSKGCFSNIVRYEQVLSFRSYFIPDYVAETDKRLYFEHGCATSCNAISIFSKLSTIFKKTEGVVHQNLGASHFVAIN